MENRVVVITGAAGALGSAVARRMRQSGAKVVLVDRAHPGSDRLKKLAVELGAGDAIACEGNVADAGVWDEILAATERALGAPTGAALIAGGWEGGSPLHEETSEVWRSMIAGNLETAHASLRALLPGMVKRGAGSIVVVGSRAVERPWTSANAAAYASSKAAVVALAQAAAAEVVLQRVRVNAILPSTLDTAANRNAMPGADASRWVTTDSAAGVIAFLLSDDARDVSGAAIPVYGRA